MHATRVRLVKIIFLHRPKLRHRSHTPKVSTSQYESSLFYLWFSDTQHTHSHTDLDEYSIVCFGRKIHLKRPVCVEYGYNICL